MVVVNRIVAISVNYVFFASQKPKFALWLALLRIGLLHSWTQLLHWAGECFGPTWGSSECRCYLQCLGGIVARAQPTFVLGLALHLSPFVVHCCLMFVVCCFLFLFWCLVYICCL